MTTCDKFEDSTPTTLEWLVACGGKRSTFSRSIFDVETKCGGKEVVLSENQGWVGYYGIENGNNQTLPGTYETRGKVRRLFQAFSLTLNEPEEIVNVGPLWTYRKPNGNLSHQTEFDRQSWFMAYKNKDHAESDAKAVNGTVFRIV